jgi:hypothetical protein
MVRRISYLSLRRALEARAAAAVRFQVLAGPYQPTVTAGRLRHREAGLLC